MKTYDIPASSSMYRYIRLRMTDKNTHGSWTFCLGGIEFYGHVFYRSTTNVAATNATVTTTSTATTASTATGAQKAPLKFVYSGTDFDKCGIVHHLMCHSRLGSPPYPISATQISNAQGKPEGPLFNVSGTSLSIFFLFICMFTFSTTCQM